MTDYDPDMLTPFGYGTSFKALGDLDKWLREHHHPEYVRRLVSWLATKGGQVGVGGGWRDDGSQPDKPGFAPEGKSFHQNQCYDDGFIGACAVDLVAVNPGQVHRAPDWSEVAAQGSTEAATWGVHSNVSSESWHMQPVEIDGWQTWMDNGCPCPQANYPIPGNDKDKGDEVTDADIERIAEAVYAKLNPVLGARPWQYMLGNIQTGKMDEAGDIMRNGAYQAYLANPDNR
jgi:hypothetical protein